ncbi:MAG TPA: hypothetical protein V6D17_16880 [Candidatus Obscuribacterales bacterium]
MDGRSVSNQTPGTHVNIDVALPQGEFLGKVTVTADMEVSHIGLPIIGKYKDIIHSRSVAGPVGYITQVPGDTCFPLAVSWDGVPKKDKHEYPPLKDLNIGDSFKMFVGSQQVKNSAFTSFLEPAASAHYINEAIAQSLGIKEPEPNFIPAVKVGDFIELNNGIVGQKRLAGSPFREALLTQPYVVLPVITGQSPFNQSRELIGFVAFKITDIEINQKQGIVETITGTIVRVAINAPQTGNTAVSKVTVLGIRLLE